MLLDTDAAGFDTIKTLRPDTRRHGRVNLLGVTPSPERDTELPFEQIDLRGVDYALSFHWRVPQASALRTGWRPSGDRLRDRAARSMMAAAVIAAADGRWVSYSRTKDYYKSQRRYQGLPYTYTNVTQIVEELLDLGLIEEERATTRCRGKRQSRFRATEALIEAFNGVKLEYEVPEIIIMRRDGQSAPFQDNRFTRNKRKRMQAVNNFHDDTVISFPTIDGMVETDTHIRIGEQVIRKAPKPHLRAIFVRGDWKAGGRMYDWYQCLPSVIRAQMLIDGEEVVELDYSSIHPSMLYAIEGVPLSFDPYLPAGASAEFRDCYKLALLTAVSAKTRRETIIALLAHKFSKKSKRAGQKWSDLFDFHDTARMVDALMRHNQPIARYLCSDAGIRLQNEDSEIALRVVERCMARGIKVLPVHDSFIAQKRHRDVLQAVMTEVMDEWKARARGLDLGISKVEEKDPVSEVPETSEVSEDATEMCSGDLHMTPGLPFSLSGAPAPLGLPADAPPWYERAGDYYSDLNRSRVFADGPLSRPEALLLFRKIRSQQSKFPLLPGQIRDLAMLEARVYADGSLDELESRFVRKMAESSLETDSSFLEPFGSSWGWSRTHLPPRWEKALRTAEMATCAMIAKRQSSRAVLH